jgi:hypothetical protein
MSEKAQQVLTVLQQHYRIGQWFTYDGLIDNFYIRPFDNWEGVAEELAQAGHIRLADVYTWEYVKA